MVAHHVIFPSNSVLDHQGVFRFSEFKGQIFHTAFGLSQAVYEFSGYNESDWQCTVYFSSYMYSILIDSSQCLLLHRVIADWPPLTLRFI
jgi:hypothetical protein